MLAALSHFHLFGFFFFFSLLKFIFLWFDKSKILLFFRTGQDPDLEG